MRILLLSASLLTLATPSIVSAQQTCEQQRSNRTVGTVAGAGIGAILGSVVAGHGDKGLGAVIGGVGGAVAGNQLAKPNADCAHAYGYYDRSSVWHATDVRADAATGYYNRDGQWVDGAPNGYYGTDGRWIAARANAQHSGYRDQNGHWVPASANGYYQADNRYVGGTASGYYNNGRWIAGPATGRYDSDGRWIPGEANGRRDAEGRWVANPEPGYYDGSGRWVRGAAAGYYDARGTWIATSAGSGYGEGRRDLASREARIQQRIETAYQSRQLSSRERSRALTELAAIQRSERQMRDRHGRLSASSEAGLQARLDRLNDGIRDARQARAY